MLELITFVLFQIATFGSSSATYQAHAPATSGYHASYDNLEYSASLGPDTVKVVKVGTGGWGHD